MLGSQTGKAAGILDHLGRSIPNNIPTAQAKPASVHPLDDPQAWLRNPCYKAPANVDIAREQKKINDIYGTTSGGEPIMLLVWAGDRDHWMQFYTQWDGYGKPSAPVERWPIIRYKGVKNEEGKLLYNTFPPRWLLLTRIEAAQIAHAWKRESYVYAPELSDAREIPDGNGGVMLDLVPVYKQIRPDECPKPLWLWYSTIAKHNGYCCAARRENWEICYGTYAEPGYCHETLYQQKKADDAQGFRPFERLEYEAIAEIADEYTGYRKELEELQADEQVYIKNPLALIGVAGAEALGLDTPQKAEKYVKEYFDRQKDIVGGKV